MGQNVVAVAFQNVFYSKKYQNNFFFTFKKLFLISMHQNDLKTPKNNINGKPQSGQYTTRWVRLLHLVSESRTTHLKVGGL